MSYGFSELWDSIDDDDDDGDDDGGDEISHNRN